MVVRGTLLIVCPKAVVVGWLGWLVLHLLSRLVEELLGRPFFKDCAIGNSDEEICALEIWVSELARLDEPSSTPELFHETILDDAPNQLCLLEVVHVAGMFADGGAGMDEPRLALEDGTDAWPFLWRPCHFLVLILRRNP